MPTIWDLLSANLWPTQPFIPPPDPTQPPAWPQATPSGWSPSAPNASWPGWPLAPTGAPPDADVSVSPWDSAVRQALAAQRSAPQDPDLADAARYERILADARRAHDFAMWAFGPPSTSQAPQTRDAAFRGASLQNFGDTARNAMEAGPSSQTAAPDAVRTPASTEATDAPRSSAADLLMSIPRGILKGLANTASTGGQAAQIEMGQPVDVPSKAETTDILERNVTGPLPRPQGPAGHYGETIGEFVGNPISYLGPGSLLPKLIGAVGSAVGSEAAGQLTKGTAAEPFARVGGAILAGSGAVKAMERGSAAVEAAANAMRRGGAPRDGTPRPPPAPAEPVTPPIESTVGQGGPPAAADQAAPPHGSVAAVRAAEPAPTSVLDNANYAQKWYDEKFSPNGPYTGRTIDDLVKDRNLEVIKPSDLTVHYIVRDGHTLIQNTRTAQVLERAGIPRSQWNAVNKTGDAKHELDVSRQLDKNGLTSEGVPTVMTIREWLKAGNPLWPPRTR